jgi:hypothetical protein
VPDSIGDDPETFSAFVSRVALKKSASGLNIARAPSFYENTANNELSSPEAAHAPFNRKASERSSMKNPEKFKVFEIRSTPR